MAGKTVRSGMWGRWILAACALMLASGLAFAAPPGSRKANAETKMARELTGMNSSDTVDVIVQYTQTPTAHHHQKVLGRGGVLGRELGLVRGGAYKLRA